MKQTKTLFISTLFLATLTQTAWAHPEPLYPNTEQMEANSASTLLRSQHPNVIFLEAGIPVLSSLSYLHTLTPDFALGVQTGLSGMTFHPSMGLRGRRYLKKSNSSTYIDVKFDISIGVQQPYAMSDTYTLSGLYGWENRWGNAYFHIGGGLGISATNGLRMGLGVLALESGIGLSF